MSHSSSRAHAIDLAGPTPSRRFVRPRLALTFALVSIGLLGATDVARAQASCTPDSSIDARVTGADSSAAREALERGNQLTVSGRSDRARIAFEESEAIARAAGDDAVALLAAASAVRSVIELGESASTSGQVAWDERVANRLESVREGLAEIDDLALRSRIELHLARSFLLISRDRRAVEILTDAATHASAALAWRLHSYALGTLGEIYESHGQYEAALDVSQRALLSAETSAAPDASYRWHWQLGRIRLALGDAPGALASYRSSAATIREAREVAHVDTVPIYDGLVKLLLDEAENAEGEAQQRLLVETRNVLEDQNVSELRDYFRDPCLDAQRKAAPDEIPGTLVVYPVLLADRVTIISSLGGKLESFRLPVGRDAFVEEVRAFRRSLEDRTSRSYLRYADKLYKWMIQPLEEQIDSDAVSTLVFVPRGALYTIPIAALYDGAHRAFLIEKVPLAITPGLTLTEPRAIDPEGTKLLAAGISESVQGYAPLESVLDEVTAIADDLPGRQLLNQTFVATSFERELAEQPFGIVHVASHGEFSANSAESFVLTYDGKISMDRLAELVGKTQFRSKSLELLTLSACESAAGDDRAALGLAGVALRAGARSALATLWSVNDQASAELMIEFYSQLTQAKRSRAEALQQAQVSILKQRAYQHPTFWAPYLLVSSWL